MLYSFIYLTFIGSFGSLLIYIIKMFKSRTGDSTLKVIYEDYSEIFIAVVTLCLSPYVVGIINPRNYYTILLVLILNFLCLGILIIVNNKQ